MDFLTPHLRSDAPYKLHRALHEAEQFRHTCNFKPGGIVPQRGRTHDVSFEELRNVLGLYMNFEHANAWSGLIWAGLTGMKDCGDE